MAEISHDATLELLGRWRLVVCGNVVTLPVRSQRVLTAIVVLGTHSRRQLAETLWPEGNHDQAFANLRMSVWEIRRRLPALLTSGHDRLDFAAGVSVDVRDLWQLGRELDRYTAVPELWQALERLQYAELLPGWDEPWLHFEQERVRALRLRALEAVAKRFLALGDATGAEEAASTAISIEPWRETAYALLMQAHALEGNRAIALGVYEQARQTLERDLRVEPVPALTNLAATLRRGGQVLSEG